MAAGKIINLEKGSHNGIEVIKDIFDFDWQIVNQIGLENSPITERFISCLRKI